MTWPPSLSATTNMRSGTSSASVKFHTSFCSATHARNLNSVTAPQFAGCPRDVRVCPMEFPMESFVMPSAPRILSRLVSPAATAIRAPPWTPDRRAAGLVESSFHPLKTSLEFAVGLSQRRFGIDRQIPRNVHQHEEQVADLFFQSRLQFFRNHRPPRSRDSPAVWTRPRRGKFRQALASILQFLRATSRTGHRRSASQSPPAAARELSLCASSSDGMADETPARIDRFPSPAGAHFPRPAYFSLAAFVPRP